MAELIQVRVRDFRAFADVSVDIPPRGIILVAGQNNAGKSAFLSALDVIAGQQENDAARNANAKRPAHVWARFHLTENERIELVGEGSKAPELLESGAARWIEWDFSETDVDRLQGLKITIAWSGGEELVVAELSLKAASTWQLLGPGVMPLAEWSPGPLTEVMSGVGGALSQALENVTNLSALESAAPILREWRRSYFHFKPLRQGSRRTTNLASTPTLASDGANLAEVLHHMQSNMPRKWQEISRLIEDIVPGVGTLMLPSEGSQFSIAFLDHGTKEFKHNIKDLGTGVEQLLMTLVVGLTAEARTVVLEEPETGLHPAAQRALLGLLQEWARDGRLFAASTHSPVFLDWTSSKIVFVRREGLVSTATEIAGNEADLLLELGVRPSDMLAAERILILEGVTDREILDIWFPQLIRNPHVAVILGGGGDSARHAQVWSAWLEQIDKIGGRKLLYVRDRDEVPAKMLAKLQSTSAVFVLPCRELENLLLDFDVIAKIINESAPERVSPGDLAVHARGIADAYKEAVVMKRVAGELVNHRYVDHQLRGQLAARRPTKQEFIAEILDRLPRPDEIRTQIDEAWDRNAEEIEADWDLRWRELVPGADLLDDLWQRYLGRGYSKSSDGVLIASQMPSPPEALARILGDFMAE